MYNFFPNKKKISKRNLVKFYYLFGYSVGYKSKRLFNKRGLYGLQCSLPPVEEVLDSVLYRNGFVHHGHGSVLQCCFSHAMVDVLVLREHPELHLCLHAHCLWKRAAVSFQSRSLKGIVRRECITNDIE